MTKECKKIITNESELKRLDKKTFGERYLFMQKRAGNCQAPLKK